jgi:putative tricarboxylic transport membrane protein
MSEASYMLNAFISGFWQTVAWPAFGYMLLGIIIGFWVGLLPGIGGLSTLALMLPCLKTARPVGPSALRL